MRKTVDTRPLYFLGRKRAPRAYKGLGTRLKLTNSFFKALLAILCSISQCYNVFLFLVFVMTGSYSHGEMFAYV